MQKKKDVRLYNVLFPLWLLIWVPSWLWLFLIPANYLIDRFVFRWAAAKETDLSGIPWRKHVWMLCIAGFLADFAGSFLLLLTNFAPYSEKKWFYTHITDPVDFNPFENLVSFLFVALIVVFSAFLIYLLDRKILKKTGLFPDEAAARIAKKMAICTAPYLFFFPSRLLYL